MDKDKENVKSTETKSKLNKSNKLLSDIVAFRSYAKYLPHKGRRETLDETIERNMEMHITKFPQLEADIREAFKSVQDLKIMPSMRALQFGGRAIESNNIRQFNCAATPVDRVRAFAEILFVLLSGTGMGFSVQRSDVGKLPSVKKPKEECIYIAHDSIEGWAECLDRLMNAYFFGGIKPVFDLSGIRDKGSYLSTTGAKAPGSEPLKIMLEAVERRMIEAIGRQLSSIEVHDIVCIVSDAVLAGGIRRCLPEGATVMTVGGLKSIEDVKVGTLVYTSKGVKPVTNVFEQGVQTVSKIITNAGDFEATPNHKMAVLTSDGYEWKRLKDLTVEDTLIHFKGVMAGRETCMPLDNTADRPLHSTTCKDITIPELDADLAWYIGLFHGDGYVYDRNFKKSGSGGSSFISTAHHSDDVEAIDRACAVVARFGVKVVVKKRKGENCVNVIVHSQRLAEYFRTFIKKPKEVIVVPEFIVEGTVEIRGAYLAGVMDSDGALNNRPPKLVTSVYKDFVYQLKNLYSSFGIPTRVSIIRPKEVNWQDKYEIALIGFRELYNKYVGVHSIKGFAPPKKAHFSYSVPTDIVLDSYRYKDFRGLFSPSAKGMPYETFKSLGKDLVGIPVKIRSIEHGARNVDTFDIEVEGDHEFYCEGLLTHNSALISLFDRDDEEMLNCKQGSWWETAPWRARANNSAVLPRGEVTKEEFKAIYDAAIKSDAGEPGFYWVVNSGTYTNPCVEISLNANQFCNLTTMNLSSVEGLEDFLSRCRHSAIIGTLQASYTDYPYIDEAWAKQTAEEALLGCSLTGICDRKDFDLSWLREGAKVIMDTNVEYAAKIGINRAARLTTVKPEGSASCVLGTSSGIHSRHAPFYLRRVRMNRDDSLAKYLMDVIPELCEDDLFSKGGIVVTIPQKSPEGALFKDGETAIQAFSRTLDYSKNWIQPGHVSGSQSHNVSVTLSYRGEEVAELFERLWAERNNYNGVSLLPYDGGTYKQAPFEVCDEATYERLFKLVAGVDLRDVKESKDYTNFNEIVACAGGLCELNI